jgi:hypothetical protein
LRICLLADESPPDDLAAIHRQALASLERICRPRKTVLFKSYHADWTKIKFWLGTCWRAMVED